MKDDDQLTLDQNFTNLLLDSMAGGVFALNKSGKINLWNSAMERISGYTAKEIMGKSCEVLSFSL